MKSLYMDRLNDILNGGIEAKRNGDFKRALECYSQAQKIDPLDSRSYGNSMKVLIALEEYEKAFRNLLILCHFNIFDDLFSKDMMAASFYQQFVPRFNWFSNKLTNDQDYEPNLIFEAIKLYPNLKDLIYRADNLTYHIGRCYVGEIKDKNKIISSNPELDINYFTNFNKGDLSKHMEQDLRDTPQEGYFLSIGFIYAHMNLNLSLKSKQEIVDYYLNQVLIIRRDLWNYGEFLISTSNSSRTIITLEQQILQLNELIKINVDRNDTEGLLETMTKIITLVPDESKMYFYRGYEYYKLKQFDKAINDFETCLQLDPNNEQTLQYLALSKRQNGDM